MRRRSRTITVSLPVGMMEQLRQAVREEGRTMSEILREIIRPFLEERERLVQERKEGSCLSRPGLVEAIWGEVEDTINDNAVSYGYEKFEAPGRVSASGPVDVDATTVFGIDFTSAPSKRKPILCLECRLVGDVLEIVEAQPWRPLRTFAEFEAFLQTPPPAGSEGWIAGADLPFGLSKKFIDNMQWSRRWGDYVDRHLEPLCRQGRQGRQAWRRMLDEYKEHRPYGDKEHLRRTDEPAGSLSPQKQYGVPVALMLLEGAPRLRAAGVTIPGLQEGSSDRMVVEAYPGVAVDNLMRERCSYKTDTVRKQTAEQCRNRQLILERLLEKSGEIYGIEVRGTKGHDVLVEDGTGDHLDALLCAVQAAWARRNGWCSLGLSAPICPSEGGIADPMLLQKPIEQR